MKRIAILAFTVSPFALVGAGAWMIYPPAALLLVGSLIWIETRFGGAK